MTCIDSMILYDVHDDDGAIDDDQLMKSLIKKLQWVAYLSQEPSSVWVLLSVQIRPVQIRLVQMQRTRDKQ